MRFKHYNHSLISLTVHLAKNKSNEQICLSILFPLCPHGVFHGNGFQEMGCLEEMGIILTDLSNPDPVLYMAALPACFDTCLQ